MTYFDYILQFAGIDHPFGDLASDIVSEVKSNGYPTQEEAAEIFEGDFSDIYEHLKEHGACSGAIDTFIESWSAYRKHERDGFKNPVPFMIADQLKQLNKNLEYICDELRIHNDHTETISDALATSDGEAIADTIDRAVNCICDVTEYKKDKRGKEYAVLHVYGEVDTYEQNA